MAMIDITEIPGIGQSTAEKMKGFGFSSANDVANAAVADLIVVPGFKEARAAIIIEKAKETLVAVAEAEAAAAAAAEEAAANAAKAAAKKASKKKSKDKKSKGKKSKDKKSKGKKKKKKK